VVSAPVVPPEEMFLPKSERIVVKPAPAPALPSSSPRSLPQRDFLKVGRRARQTRYTVAGIATGIFLLLVLLVWWLSGSGTQTMTAEASASGPVLAGGEKTEPRILDENLAAVKKETVLPTPSVRTGILKLNSDPPGALVYIDEERKGVTPLTVKDSALGSQVSIRIELEGHRSWTQSVVLDEKNPVREFTAGLPKEEVCEIGAGWIYVTTVPEGGTVEIDGKRLSGKTPMIINDVCAGVEHEIRVQASGFQTWRRTVTVQPRKVLNLNVDLER
jgi:hypothetical protein